MPGCSPVFSGSSSLSLPAAPTPNRPMWEGLVRTETGTRRRARPGRRKTRGGRLRSRYRERSAPTCPPASGARLLEMVEHLVGGHRQAVGLLELGVEPLGETAVCSQEPAPRAELSIA